MNWIKKNISKLLLLCLIIVTYFMLCFQHEGSSARKEVGRLYKENQRLEQENKVNNIKIATLSNNFKSLFEFVNDRKYNKGRGVITSYDLQYQGLSIENTALGRFRPP